MNFYGHSQASNYIYKMKQNISIIILLTVLILNLAGIRTIGQDVEVSGTSLAVISLNGTWKFSMNPPDKHWENSVDFSEWPDILVPGECQMQGMAIKHDIPYVYKKIFEVPADFEGKLINLDFHGVYSHARVWVNGEFVREHRGGFTRWSCPISEIVKAGESAILTLEIIDPVDDISYGSGYAKHQIGGILRSVELRALPQQHFEKFYIETELDEEFKDAELRINYALKKSTPVRVLIELLNHRGEKVEEVEKELQKSNGVISIPVKNPKKWDAEHPHLHTLLTTLFENGKPTITRKTKIGFREVKVDGNRLLVNGSPVKLRGACRHDIHPILGRMTTAYYDSLDVILAKESNMNFIRTSHYPPSEAFLDYCDKYGIYVEDETAVCFVGSHRTEAYRASGASQSDPDFTSRYMSQLDEMLHYHRNHPSVIIWSIGNENVFGDNFIQSFKQVKEKDSTRPVIYSYPGQVPDTLVNYEILSMHYPDWQGNLKQYDISTRKFSYDKMPVLFDEWAHVACYNNFELKHDPNVRNFWGQSLDSMWTYTFNAEGGLGGAIWCMLDETFALPADMEGFNEWWGILDKTVIPVDYMGPTVGYGEWGIVDTWRRKKPEFWGTKKAYSPTRILVKSIDTHISDKAFSIPVHNRYDHTNFNELVIRWKYGEQSGILEGINLKPHQKGILNIPANSWRDGEKLQVAFYEKDSMLVDRYELILGSINTTPPLCEPGDLKAIETSDKINLIGKEVSMDVNKITGLLEDVIVGGDTLIKSGPYLNLWVPGDAAQYSSIKMDDLARDWKCTKFSYSMENGVATMISEGKYENLTASFFIRLDENGIMEISYEASVGKTKKTIEEAGIKFLTGSSLDKISWKRDAYFSAYPESHPGRPAGEAFLSYKPESQYREEPKHDWAHDTWGFYYFGLNEAPYYNNDVRSMKENIYEYALISTSKAELKVLSNGEQACRFDLFEGNNTLMINNQWDYNSLRWGNYMKGIPLENKIHGKIYLKLTALSP